MFFLRYTFRLVLGALLSLALFSPTFAAPPQLFVDNPGDHEINHQVLSGAIAVYGWALGTTAPIERVEVSVDGGTPMELGYGGERLDVAAAFPSAPEAAHSGFAAVMNTRIFTNGWHEFSVTAMDENGETVSQTFMVLISNAPGAERPSSVALDLSKATARVVQDKNAVLIENADINGQSITTPLLFDISSNQFSMIAFVADADDDGVRDDDLNADGFADNDLNRDGFPDDDLDFNGLSDSQERSGPFVSSGASRGLSESPLLKYNETFAGLFTDTEIAMTYDEVTETFIGRVRNEAPQAVCDVQVDVVLDGDRTVNTTPSGRPLQISGLIPGGRRNFEFPVPGTTFDDWTVMVETFQCSSAPSGTAGSGSGEGSEGGGEGGGEHGSGGEGGVVSMAQVAKVAVNTAQAVKAAVSMAQVAKVAAKAPTRRALLLLSPTPSQVSFKTSTSCLRSMRQLAHSAGLSKIERIPSSVGLVLRSTWVSGTGLSSWGRPFPRISIQTKPSMLS